MTNEMWMCERHPWLEWNHNEAACGAPGMLLEESLGILKAMYELCAQPGAWVIRRDEGKDVQVTLTTYGTTSGDPDDRLPDGEWLNYFHENLMGAVVNTVADVWPVALAGLGVTK